jgi:hypothetical protein
MPEEISLEKITELLLEFLDGLGDSEKIKTIDKLIDRLRFEKHTATPDNPLLTSWAKLGKDLRWFNRVHKEQKP